MDRLVVSVVWSWPDVLVDWPNVASGGRRLLVEAGAEVQAVFADARAMINESAGGLVPQRRGRVRRSPAWAGRTSASNEPAAIRSSSPLGWHGWLRRRGNARRQMHYDRVCYGSRSSAYRQGFRC